MALTALPVNSPLTQLRAQGLEAEFNRARVIVYPRPKITNTLRQFVSDNLVSIVNELNLEGYYTKNPDPLGYAAKSTGDGRRNQGWLIWSLNSDLRTELGARPVDETIDAVPDALNGYLSF
ncbi:hypothetical protein [Methylomonas koyamae]|uniref:Uncharacterized protein n=1 Tax=Methylomonas koyamae TaxID=702114 RepID=A0A291IGM5_9GAMM|nr:hypothetical protein [Methylomonas koyamae]ATG89462.1 hypothetical protein MKLM6_1205 [Methylomonas koyamae]OAI22774.1 hypothetical protein A1356_18745 [Methylomonas koyamae]